MLGFLGAQGDVGEEEWAVDLLMFVAVRELKRNPRCFASSLNILVEVMAGLCDLLLLRGLGGFLGAGRLSSRSGFGGGRDLCG